MRSETSQVIAEYLVVLLYLLLLIAYGCVEAAWIKRRQWSTWSRSLVFALLTNLIGFCLGFALAFVTLGVSLALAWDGSMKNLPLHGNEFAVVYPLVLLVLPTILALLKRAAASILNIGQGQRIWLFCIGSSLGFWIVPLVAVIALTMLLWPIFMRR